MEKLYSNINCRLIDNNLDFDEKQLTDIDKVLDMNDTQTVVCQILEQHRAGKYILVVTDSQVVCNLVLAFNPTLKNHKISVYCNGELFADEAIAEIERREKTLHSESGTEYLPKQSLENGIYASENGEILFNCYSESDKFGTKFENLYTYTGQVWGFVLPFKMDSLIGRITEQVDKMMLNDKRLVATEIVKCFKEANLTDSIYLFRTESGIEILPIGGNYITSEKEFYMFLYEIFFGHAPQRDRMASILQDRMEYSKYPGCLFEFFELAFADKIYPGLSNISASIEFLENTLSRMAFMTKEV